MKDERNLILGAFPTILANDVQNILDKVQLSTEFNSSGFFNIITCNETVSIPQRVYYEETKLTNLNQLSQVQKYIIHCLFTCHHDGLVREKHLKQVILSINEHVWVVPFVIRLLGEYVIEILYVINNNLKRASLETIKIFNLENPDFFKLTEQRVMSYWNEYYRLQYPRKEDYIGFQILKYLRS
jgi:hypothetical protein